MKDLNIKIHVFEGPLDLLYHLIEKNEIDIYDIPIAELTEQYIVYLSEMQDRDMESMSQFLVMAATLLEIKSKMLLPRNDTNESLEDDPREKLMQHLLEYKMYKKATELFRKKSHDAEKVYFRESGLTITEDTVSVGEILSGITLNKLYSVFEDILKRRELKTDKIRSSFNAVKKDRYNIKDKMLLVEDLLEIHRKIRFSEVFADDVHKMEKVVTFLAVLELIRINRVLIKQDENFGEIFIEKA